MKYIVLLIIIGFSISCSFNKEHNGTVISPYADTLFDKSSNLTFYLDTSRTIVYAFSKNNKLIWKTNPRKDNNIIEYRIVNPQIYYFNLDTCGIDTTIEIYVEYNNSQRVWLDKKTGKSLGWGQL